MSLSNDDTITLGNTKYHIERRLGQGAVASVYLASIVGEPDSQVVIKLVRGDAAEDPLKIEGLRREAEVLRVLNRAEDALWPAGESVVARLRRSRETKGERFIIALLDAGDQHGQPFVVQEMAPPAIERFDVVDLDSERRMLGVMYALAQSMALAHRNGLAFKDFEPQTKVDRIRLNWLSDNQGNEFELKIIDWNITGGEKDFKEDLFLLGLHFYYFLVGRHLILGMDRRPPADLSALAPEAWKQLTEGTRIILSRLLLREESRRYQRIDEVVSELKWWLNALDLREKKNVFDRLQDKIWQVRPQGRHDRVLALADLGLRLSPPDYVEHSLKNFQEQAQKELDKEHWRPIASAYSTLLTGRAYARAVDEFADVVESLPEDGEPARLARIYLRLAQVGKLLRQDYEGEDIRHTGVWRSFSRAVEQLKKRRWEKARDALNVAVVEHPAAKKWRPVQELLNLTEAWLLVQEANEIGRNMEPREADALRDNWVEVEEAQLELSAEVVQKLNKAKQLAPQEPGIVEKVENEQERYKLRQGLLAQYKEVETYISEGDGAYKDGRVAQERKEYAVAAAGYERALKAYEGAQDKLVKILESDVVLPQHRARVLDGRLAPRLQKTRERYEESRVRAETIRKGRELWDASLPLLRAGRYGEAVSKLRQAVELLPEQEEWREVLQMAMVGAELERRAESNLEFGKTYFGIRKLGDAMEAVEEPLSWNQRPMRGLPGGGDLPAAVGGGPFVLRDEVRAELSQLRDLIHDVQQAYGRIDRARENRDYQLVITVVEELQKRLKSSDEKLSENEKEWKEDAERRLEKMAEGERVWRKAQSLLIEGRYEEAVGKLRQAVELLPEQEEWREVLQMAKVGARLEKRAESNLEAAKTYFEIRKLREALDAVEEPLRWNQRPMKVLPGGEELPAAVGVKPFMLQDERLSELDELSKLIQVVQEAHEQAESARAKGDYQLVLTVLNDLSEKLRAFGLELNEDERKWMAEASRRLKVREQADEELKLMLNFERLKELVAELEGDRGKEAGFLRKRAGEQWRRLVEKLTDWREVKDRLREGSHIFGDVEKVEKRLDEMLGLVEDGEQVVEVRLLEVEPGDSFPRWLQEERAGRILSEIEVVLEHLQGERSWSALRELGQRWRDKLLGYLATYSNEKLKEARALSREGRYQEAREQLEALKRLIPESLRPAGWKWVMQFLSELIARDKAEEELHKLLNQLEEGRLTFKEAVELADKVVLPEDSDVPVGDLETLRKELAVGAEMESALARGVDEGRYAQEIYERERLAKEPLLHVKVDELRQQLQESARKLVKQLREELKQAIKELRDRPEIGTERVLMLYWQALWQVVRNRELSEVKAARELPNEILQQVHEKLMVMKSRRDLLQASKMLAVVRELNDGLVRMPQGEDEVELPPLPEGREYPEMKPRFERESLKQLAEEIASLEAVKEVSLRDDSGYERELVREIGEVGAEVGHVIVEMKEVGRKLGLEWPASNSLESLAEEGLLYKQIASLLEEAYDFGMNMRAMEGLTKLQQEVEADLAKLEEFTLGVFESHRKVLKSMAERLKGVLIDALGGQVAVILGEPRDIGVTRLRAEMLEPPSEEIIEDVHKAILEGVSKRAEESQEKGRRDEARSLWLTVIKATEGLGRWESLHQEATKRHKELGLLSKGMLIAVVAVAILILMGGGLAGNKYYLQPMKATNEAQTTADAIALATRAQEMAAAQRATATAEYLSLHQEAQSTAVAQAATATKQAEEFAASATRTAMAQAATATFEAEQTRCRDINLYSLAVGEPELSPEVGRVYISGNPQPDVYVKWVVTNTGECAWPDVSLLLLPESRLEGDAVVSPMPVEPGATAEVTVRFLVNEVDESGLSREWVLKVNGLALLEQAHLKLAVPEDKRWVVIVTPTPTPSPTPTLTPTPTPTLVPPPPTLSGGADHGK